MGAEHGIEDFHESDETTTKESETEGQKDDSEPDIFHAKTIFA